MRMSERDFLLAYFYNHEVQIEEELREYRERVRFRRIGIEDCIELMLTMQRLADFREFRHDVERLLHL